jgi:23S rRNA (cytidine1920-2'-O)/16S rRNA (cytidine1409-2'-O)-methyltransferase
MPELVLGPIASTLRVQPSSPIVALVKPQFEVGRGGTDHGVVRDPEVHRAVLRRVSGAAAGLGLGTRAVMASPLLGPEGNREFLVHLQAGPSCAEIDERIDEAVGPRPDDGAADRDTAR